MNDKLLSLLGMCRRAGKMEIGFAKSVEAVQNGKACLILVAQDVAQRTEKEVRFKTKEQVPIVRIDRSLDELSHAIGVSAGTIALTDDGFAKQALLLIDDGGMNL